ncbi:MAG: hypothetical protein AB1801_04305 [Chloroflexota bacterium]
MNENRDALRSTRRALRPARPIFHLLKKIDAGLLLAGLMSLFLIQPLLQPGLPAAADLTIHLYRTLEYGQAWAPGVIAPRWAPNLAYGYGYPLFVFAPPLPYALGLALHGCGLSLPAALKTLIILTIPLYAIGMALLARDLLHSVEAGLIAATAYALAPFAIREALLYGGNIPQFLAIGLFPWTLWAMARAARTGGWGWAGLSAICLAGVILSHLFQALIFVPVVGVFGSMLFFEQRTAGRETGDAIQKSLFSRRLSSSPASYLPLLTIPLGLLLTAFFWLPAFVERYATRAQADIYLAKSPFFVRYPHWTELIAWIAPLDARAANPYVPLTLGVATLGLAGLGLAAASRQLLIPNRPGGKQRGEEQRRAPLFILFFALLALAATFMTLPASRPVWETFSILQVAEFPWRMLGLANLGWALVAGAAVLLLPRRIRRPATAVCLAVQVWAVAPLLYPVTGFTRYGRLTMAEQIDYERRSQSIGTTTLGEYLPQTVGRVPITSPLVEAFKSGQNPERLDRSRLPAGAAATLLEQTAVTHRYRLDTPTAVTLRFFQFDFPGWRAKLDGQPLAVRPEAETGLILLDIPAGQHTLTLHFGETPIRIVAIALTGLTVVGLVTTGVYKFRRSAVSDQSSVISDQSSVISDQLSVSDSSSSLIPHPSSFIPHPSSLIPPPSSLLIITALLLLAAFWLKPRLRPVFTLQSPPDRAWPAQHDTRIDFANGIQLIGYDLSRAVVEPGGYLQVVLYWQTRAAPYRVNLQPFVHLDRLDDFTTIAGATNYTPGDVTTESNMPTFHWDNTRYVRDEHDLLLPSNAAPLAYAVRVGLIDPAPGGKLIPLAGGRGDTPQLTTINVAGRERATPLAEPLDMTFRRGDDALRLTGFELVAQTPERLDFTLSWQTDRPLQTDYTIFAQLLDLDHNLASSFDSPPLAGAYPTSTWLPGQTIFDPRRVPLAGVPPGDYRLLVGLYDPVTQQRLARPDGADFAELTTITIQR